MIKLNLMRGRIPLTQGQVAKVDEKDWEELSRFKWHAAWSPNTNSFYAKRNVLLSDGRRRLERMHRKLMGLKHGDPLQVDHINHDTLDNRRANLRIATNRTNHENLARASVYGTGVSVRPELKSRPYQVLVMANGKKQNIGLFASPEEAQVARKTWLQERGLV